MELPHRRGRRRSAPADLASAPDVVVLPDRRIAALLVAGAADDPGDVDTAGGIATVFDTVGQCGLLGVSVREVITVAISVAFDDVLRTAFARVRAVVILGTRHLSHGRGESALAFVLLVRDRRGDGDGLR